MIRKRYKLFSRLYNESNVPKEYNKNKMFWDAMKDRLILGIHFEEYFRDSYYSLGEERPTYDHYYALSDLSEYNRQRVFFDYMLCRLKLGIRVEEYFRNEFYKLRWKERETYFTTGIKQKFMKEYNDRNVIPEIDNKEKFDENFKEFLKREWVDLEAIDRKSFIKFTEEHPYCFCKQSDGLQGIGAMKIDFNIESAEKFYDQYSGKRVILEEQIIQHHSLAEFNSSTVNTLRVVSFVRGNGSVEILRAALRIGRSDQIADNFHMHGIAANIDIETGIIMSTAVDSHFNRYLVHPDSGKIIPGFVIPHWDLVKTEVEMAAKKFPEVRYVGWDIAIRENDICFVEGNSTACPDVIEMPIRQGAWKVLKSLSEN